MKLGKRLFYDKITGEVFFKIDEQEGLVILKTVEQDIETYTALSERNREIFDVLELPFGAFAQDFAECSGYRVNPETKTLEFNYPDPNTPVEEPVYQPPLTEQVTGLKGQVFDLDTRLMMLEMGGMM